MFTSIGWFIIGVFVGLVGGLIARKLIKRNNPDIPII